MFVNFFEGQCYCSFTPAIYYAIVMIIMFKGCASIFTARKQSLGQGNVFTPVCHSVHRRGGVCPPPRMCTPPDAHPPGCRPPPGMQSPPPPPDTSDTVNKRAIRVLLECILVAIAIAITIHPIEKNRNCNSVINRRCEWTSKDNWSVKSLVHQVCCSTKWKDFLQMIFHLCDLQKNRLSSDSEPIQKLSTIMSTKDPFYKPPVSPDLESMQHSST